MSSIGIMDGAFFVGRKEIVDWINTTLELNLDKVEETASGAVACQLFDIMHPGVVPMNKVNWSANKDFEYVANYKVLQSAFTKMHVDKHVDVDRLIKGKYQDNLEFMQWFKRFFEMSVSDKGDYDVVGQRCRGRGGAEYGQGKKTKPTARSAPRVSAPAKRSTTAVAKENTAPHGSTASTAKSATRNIPSTTSSKEASKPKAVAPSSVEVTALKNVNEALNKQLAEMKLEMDGLVTERDFYFDKLRDVEMMLQEMEDSGRGNELTANIFKILYATADGFEAQDKAVTQEADTESAPVPAENVVSETVQPPEAVSADDAETY